MNKLLIEKTNIDFVVAPDGVATECKVTYVTENNCEKKAVITFPGEKFSYECHSQKSKGAGHK